MNGVKNLSCYSSFVSGVMCLGARINRDKMKKKLFIGVGIVVILVAGYFFLNGKTTDGSVEVIVPVKNGRFAVEIETSGELEAKNSVPIKGPGSLRNFRIYNLTIQSIIDEGTVVQKGQWIATLDKSEFQGRLQDKQIELDQDNSQYVQTQLDTTLQMRQARDELINLQYAVEEQEIILEQSKFEPPATIKQAEINLDKARRALDQAKQNYKIKKRQAIERMREVASELRKTQIEYNEMLAVEEEFTIIAPEPGMVIYQKGHDGKQIKAGSQISMWDPTVATLPDLSVMLSKTYVNEVDIRKVKVGQPVEIGLDAFPDKALFGKIVRVANVGEQRANSDAKVFQVNIEIDGTDSDLRPAMTTSNKIIAETIDSALFVPLESLHSKDDSITFVYKKEGINVVKQEVEIGAQNADDVVILQGLSAYDNIYLSVPSGLDEASIRLIPELNGKRKKEEIKPEPVQEMKGRPMMGGRKMEGQRPDGQGGTDRKRPQGN